MNTLRKIVMLSFCILIVLAFQILPASHDGIARAAGGGTRGGATRGGTRGGMGGGMGMM